MICQTFGTAILKTPDPRPLAAPARGDRYACGRYGKLTVAQIAEIAGTSKTAIFKRIKAGYRDEQLCAPRWSTLSSIRKLSPPRSHILVAAFVIAERYPNRLPTLAEIQRLRPMSKQNAQQWRQAIATARSEIE